MTNDLNTSHARRTFLVVVDDSDELGKALLYTCRRAESNNGDIILLHVIDPVEFQHWASVGDLMRAEIRAAAEEKVNAAATQVRERLGREPKVIFHEDSPVEAVLAVLEEEPRITALVLGASANDDGPGPLVDQLTGKLIGKLHVPLIVIPGSMTDEQIMDRT